MEQMRAWATPAAGRIALETRSVPVPERDEVLVRVLACGVCRTDLHIVDRELEEHRDAVVPGHQVVGEIVATGRDVRHLRRGDRVGIAWLRRTCGACRWCRTGRENLCPDALFTGWDADGGYAELTTVPESFAYPLPADADPVESAPLLCAGIIGYRALRRAQLPPGGRLGIYGFGSSAHVTAQLAAASGAEVYAMTRGARNQELARRLGVAFVGEAREAPPVPLDSAIVFAPAGDLMDVALRATARGGTVVSAGIHMTDLPPLVYEETLFYERDLRTVTANTRADGSEFLALARNLELRPEVSVYPFERVADALDDLREGRASGSLVVAVEGSRARA